ncbi:MAG: glycine--tRNA ligase, partial [Planctomycetes bacterium]|nr:glycine--tRNA ligase [Planctomycetota bacterium]
MERIVALCKRRGFIFQSSEIYGGINGFWDYGPLGVELKRNLKDAWWNDMVHHPPLGPDGHEFTMVGLDCAIIMHPQVWKCSGHYDLFADKMQTCRQCKKLFRSDFLSEMILRPWSGPIPTSITIHDAIHQSQNPAHRFLVEQGASPDEWTKTVKIATGARKVSWTNVPQASVPLAARPAGVSPSVPFCTLDGSVYFVAHDLFAAGNPGKCPQCGGDLTPPRDFNLMFETHYGALQSEDNKAFLRPETAQGIFVNFKNVIDSTRVKVPFGIAQMGKSFRNEITPRNFTFRSREFEQMEIEFFCHPSESNRWYEYWRDTRVRWYTSLGLQSSRLRLREHGKEELSHYSCGTSDIEYAFPFLTDGDFGELEGVAHRGDFDLRSHMEGKLAAKDGQLVLDVDPDGKPKHKGSGKDLTYFDDERKERFVPHVIEPSAGADRGTLAFICEAYTVDESRPSPELMRFHPRLAPIKAAVFPLVNKDALPEIAEPIYRAVRERWPAQYDAKASIGKRYA